MLSPPSVGGVVGERWRGPGGGGVAPRADLIGREGSVQKPPPGAGFRTPLAPFGRNGGAWGVGGGGRRGTGGRAHLILPASLRPGIGRVGGRGGHGVFGGVDIPNSAPGGGEGSPRSRREGWVHSSSAGGASGGGLEGRGAGGGGVHALGTGGGGRGGRLRGGGGVGPPRLGAGWGGGSGERAGVGVRRPPGGG